MILPIFGLLLALAAHLAAAPFATPASLTAAALAVPLSPSALAVPLSPSADSSPREAEDAGGVTVFARTPDVQPPALPSGASAAAALVRQAAQGADLKEAALLLERAMRVGKGLAAGSQAALELARLEYAAGRPSAALRALTDADAWPRPEALRPEWLYWRGQSRLALKRWASAEQDFRKLVLVWPRDARAEAARLGEADCLAALGEDEAAGLYTGLVSDAGPYGAQALWGLGTLRLRQGRTAEARRAYLSLRTDYPDSFEARMTGDALGSMPAAGPAAHAGLRGLWSVQVGAYSQLRWAEQLAVHLRARRFRVQVRRKWVAGRVLYLVQVGPYATRPAASAAARVLQDREKLPFNLVEE